MWNLEHNGQIKDDMHALVRQKSPSVLLLGTNFRTVKQGDWFWLNLTKPYDHVVAVAEVAGEPIPQHPLAKIPHLTFRVMYTLNGERSSTRIPLAAETIAPSGRL